MGAGLTAAGDAVFPMAVFLQDRAGPEDAGWPVGRWVRRRWQLSTTLYRRLKAQGGLLVNGQSVPAFHPLQAGDQVALALPARPSAEPQPLPLDVVFEDEHLLVVDKPAGLVMHPSRGHPDGTLVNAVAHHRLQRGEPGWVHPLHRLDRDTSGLVLVAKNPYVHERLVRLRRLRRIYVALLRGHVGPASLRVELPVSDPPPEAGPARAVAEGGRMARTRLRVAWRSWMDGHAVSVAVVTIDTGRTHQIRLHMAHLGHPVVGDRLYGPQDGVGAAGRLCLHARKLCLRHPMSGRVYVWRSPPPFPLPPAVRAGRYGHPTGE